MKPLAAYARVSFVGKRGGDSFHADEDQMEEIRRWAKARGRTIVEFEPELNAKGNDPSRPVFREIVQGIKDGIYGGMVVAYMSRAGRSTRLMLTLWEEIEENGGEFHSVREQFDGTTSTGRMMRTFLAAQDQKYREDVAEGFERQTKGATERGIVQHRQTSRGYDKDPDTRKLVVNEKQKLEVVDAFNSCLKGEPIASIARRIGMTPSGVRQMLKNRVYLGEMRKRSYVNTESHDPIIDKATFEAVQQRLTQNTRPPRSDNPTPLLSGLVYCASCGHVMTRGSATGGTVYICQKNHSGEICPGPAAISQRKLDEYVRPIGEAELARLQVEATKGDKLKPIELRLEEARLERTGYAREVKGSEVGWDVYNAGLASRREAEDTILEELATERARRPAMPIDGNAAEVFKDLNAHDQNTVFRGLLAGVVVKRAGRGKRIPVEDRARVIKHGHDVGRPKRRGGEASGIVALPFPDADAIGVLRVASV